MHGIVPKGIKSGIFKLEKFSSNINYSKYRLTLDRKEDLDLIRKIYSKLGEYCKWKEVVSYINENPSLKKINSHISTNEGSLISLQTMKKNRIQKNRYKNSNLLFKKALKFIPTGSQTFQVISAMASK